MVFSSLTLWIRSFSLPDFVAEVQEVIKPVLTSYIKVSANCKLISKMKDAFIPSPENIITVNVAFLLTNSCIASGLIIKLKFLTWRFSSCNTYLCFREIPKL